MTNFENWRQNLKLEDLIIDFGENFYDDEFRISGALDCRACPAKGSCSVGIGPVDHRKGCGYNFLEWAKKEMDNK